MNLDTENKLNISAKDLAGKMIAVLGITGSGKTNTAAVLIEELLATNIPLAIVDIEGEFWGLKEKFEILIAGRSENADIEVAPEQAGQVARLSVEKEIPVILDLSGFKKSEMYAFLLNFFEALWEANKDQRKPYAIFIEEAHEFIPQSQAANPALKELITQFALRGRKRGFRVVVMSQRSAKVAKNVSFSQSRTISTNGANT
jgi:DNA helicase HerA-like ATPase